MYTVCTCNITSALSYLVPIQAYPIRRSVAAAVSRKSSILCCSVRALIRGYRFTQNMYAPEITNRFYLPSFSVRAYLFFPACCQEHSLALQAAETFPRRHRGRLPTMTFSSMRALFSY